MHLLQLIRKNKYLSLDEILWFSMFNCIAHKDIKPDNLVVCEDTNLNGN